MKGPRYLAGFTPPLMAVGRFSMITMPGIQTGRFTVQKLVHAALFLMLAVWGGTVFVAAAPPDNSYVASLRRLTEQEYRNSIADIFGKEIEVRGSFEPTIRTGGMEAASTATLSVTPVGFESFSKMANDRSEERRVGKECRCRRARDTYKKKER